MLEKYKDPKPIKVKIWSLQNEYFYIIHDGDSTALSLSFSLKSINDNKLVSRMKDLLVICSFERVVDDQIYHDLLLQIAINLEN